MFCFACHCVCEKYDRIYWYFIFIYFSVMLWIWIQMNSSIIFFRIYKLTILPVVQVYPTFSPHCIPCKWASGNFIIVSSLLELLFLCGRTVYLRLSVAWAVISCRSGSDRGPSFMAGDKITASTFCRSSLKFFRYFFPLTVPGLIICQLPMRTACLL